MARLSDREMAELRHKLERMILSRKDRFTVYDITKQYLKSIGIDDPRGSESARPRKQTEKLVVKLSASRKLGGPVIEEGNNPTGKKNVYWVRKK